MDPLCQHILLSKTDVICICTDNFKVYIAAFDVKYSHHEIQHVIRLPCSAHMVNLAIKDMFERDHTYGFVINVTSSKRYLSKDKIRWTSLFECAKFFALIIHHSKNQIIMTLSRIQEKINSTSLEQLLERMNIFVLNAEKDSSNINDILPHHLNAYS